MSVRIENASHIDCCDTCTKGLRPAQTSRTFGNLCRAPLLGATNTPVLVADGSGVPFSPYDRETRAAKFGVRGWTLPRAYKLPLHASTRAPIRAVRFDAPSSRYFSRTARPCRPHGVGVLTARLCVDQSPHCRCVEGRLVLPRSADRPPTARSKPTSQPAKREKIRVSAAMAAKHSGSRQRSDSSHKQPQATAPLPPALHLLHSLDQRLSHALFRRGSRVPRWVWKLFELSGDGLVWLALAIGCALAPGTAPAARHAWAAFLLCWAVDLALVGLIKASIRRSRPVYNLRSDFTVVVAVDHFSFPSGHSSRSAAGAAASWQTETLCSPAFVPVFCDSGCANSLSLPSPQGLLCGAVLDCAAGEQPPLALRGCSCMGAGDGAEQGCHGVSCRASSSPLRWFWLAYLKPTSAPPLAGGTTCQTSLRAWLLAL